MLNPIEYLYLEYYQYAIVSLILLINLLKIIITILLKI